MVGKAAMIAAAAMIHLCNGGSPSWRGSLYLTVSFRGLFIGHSGLHGLVFARQKAAPGCQIAAELLHLIAPLMKPRLLIGRKPP
jgi:hypothetical protein